MNQIKIGAFISERRKAKGWTQSQLAEKLEITDKAVSKWESKESDTVSQNVLEVENVSKLYENNSVLAVNSVSFGIPHGSFVGIMGASGSGKTTLLNLIATIDRPTNGTIRISGQNIADIPDETAAEFRRRHLGFVFQEYNLLETLTIYENIALALTMKEVSKESIGPMIQNLSEKLGISAILDKFPYEVSGGERQRSACARAIVVNPDIILADEPTGALDSHAARQLLDTLAMLCREYGATILMVTHDVMAASYCDRILFMKDGEIKTALNREQESKQTFFADILKKIEWIEGES